MVGKCLCSHFSTMNLCLLKHERIFIKYILYQMAIKFVAAYLQNIIREIYNRYYIYKIKFDKMSIKLCNYDIYLDLILLRFRFRINIMGNWENPKINKEAVVCVNVF